MNHRTVAFGLVLFSTITSLPGQETETSKRSKQLLLGVDTNYSLDMESKGDRWHWSSPEPDLFRGMAAQGVTELRVRLWTNNDGVNGRDYATRVVQRATAAGLNPYLVLFLSPDWADLMKQPMPAEWAKLSFEDRLVVVREYSRTTVAHFRSHGLTNHLYEIGNEIDYGICGEYPGKSSKKTPESLSRRLWPRSAEIIKASQSGVLEADPDAKFMLHISHWWDTEFCVAFFQFMIDSGVQVDYAGLSYFPSSNIGGSRDFDELGRCITKLARTIDRRIIIPETAYPSTRDFKGQFSRWKYEVAGYPLTDEGQRRWLQDLFIFCNSHPDIEAVYYWSPEWFGEGMWKGFALFDPTGHAKPAWASFKSDQWKTLARKQVRYLQCSNDTLVTVPVESATQAMLGKVRELLQQTQGVNTEHIRLLDQTSLVVEGYSVRLKSSLQKNLSLTLTAPDKASAVPIGSQNPGEQVGVWLQQFDPTRERIVVFSHTPQSSLIETLRAAAARSGLQIDIHPLREDQAIVFGLSDAPLSHQKTNDDN